METKADGNTDPRLKIASCAARQSNPAEKEMRKDVVELLREDVLGRFLVLDYRGPYISQLC